MQDSPAPLETPLAGLNWQEWCDKTQALAEADGFGEMLGEKHAAVFIEKKPVLLVSFESFARLRANSDDAHPLGWQLMDALGWSHLSIVSNGDTWFRDRRVIGFFDRLIDDGFFEDFEQVIFYGAGPCGYAAAAYSVAAPGSKVLVLQPQATLDPRVTEWDERFLHMRRTDFTDRFGYAPDMLDAADHAWVVYDPNEDLDAMHAALFTRPNVTKVRVRFMGSKLETSLLRVGLLLRMLAQISAGKLHGRNLSRLLRHRRDEAAFQFNLLQHLEEKERHWLVAILCREVLKRRPAKPFHKALVRAESALAKAGGELADETADAAGDGAAEAAGEALDAGPETEPNLA